MSLDTRALTRATVTVSAVSYIACYVLVALAPGAAMGLFGNVLHTDLGALAPRLGVVPFAEGLVFWAGITAVAAWLTATLYNRAVQP